MTDNTKITLDDMRNATVTSGYSVVADGTGGYFHSLVSGGGGGLSAHNLDYHDDVVVTSVANNEVLAYDTGGDWINQTPSEAGLAEETHTHVETDITDLDHDAVSIRGVDVVDWPPTLSGQALIYDGNVWVPGTVSGGGGDGMSPHDIEGGYHTLASATSGYVMQAHTATTFGFTPLLAQDLPAHSPESHTHVENDITNLDHDAVSLRGKDIVNWPPTISGQLLVYDGNVWYPNTVSGLQIDTKQVKVSSNDQVEAYLEDKISAGTGVTVTTLNEGANEVLQFTASGGGGEGADILEVQVFM